MTAFITPILNVSSQLFFYDICQLRQEIYIKYGDEDDDEQDKDDDKVQDILRGDTSQAQRPQTGGRNQYKILMRTWTIK